MTTVGGAQEALEWKFVQSFGDDNSSDGQHRNTHTHQQHLHHSLCSTALTPPLPLSAADDLVTTVEFDETGDFLAVGDKAGRICIFDCHTSPPPPPPSHHPNVRPPPPPLYLPLEYKFYTEFQSHEPEFDCLKSLEIEEKINCIRWAKRSSSGHFLLATNDKTIKLWKVWEKKIKARRDTLQPKQRSAANFVTASPAHHHQLHIPRLTHSQTITTASPKRVYANAHGFHVHSISLNSDGQTFISADDLRLNLWHVDVANEAFNIVDLKPTNLEELTEVITSATFHPQHCNLLLYSSSRGAIRLVDLRDNALCDQHAKQLEADDDIATKSFFSEIISSISDCRFSGSEGRYVVSRDYLTVKLWDLHMEAKPVLSIPVHDLLKTHLCDLYENDCIFDRFNLDVNAQGTRGVTGSYNNHFVLFDLTPPTAQPAGQAQQGGAAPPVTIEALKDGPRRKDAGVGPGSTPGSGKKTKSAGKERERDGGGKERDKAGGGGGLSMGGGDALSVQSMDFGKKALHVAWHPRGNTVAVAGLNKLYIYSAAQGDAGKVG